MRRKNSVTVCIRCNGDSQIEDTLKQDTNYVKRTRACVRCGLTWATAEVPLADIKKIKALIRLLKELK
jgi:transcriptional regulator NrdR family protein